jgi:hypothetical protein
VKRALALTSLLCILGITWSPAGAQTGAAQPGTGKAGPKKWSTVRGEVLDLGCYLAKGLSGEIHRECALKCLGAGVPMGIITADSVVYVLTQDHGRAMAPSTFTNPDQFALVKQWAAKIVEVTGFAHQRGNTRIIEVSKAKLIPAPTPGAAQ